MSSPGIFSVSKLLVATHENATSRKTVAIQNATKMRQNNRCIMAVAPAPRSRGVAELAQQVAAAMDRGDRRAAIGCIAELAAQVGHVHVDRSVERAERAAEHALRDALLADH